MKIKKLCNSSINPKTGKIYSSIFKQRTVQYLLMGMYDEQTIWEKFQINSTLLLEWRKWYYEHFEAKNYPTPNYGKELPTIVDGQIVTESNQRAQRATESLSERAKQRKAEEARFRAYSEKFGGKTSHKIKKKWWKQVQELRKEFPQTSLKNLCALYQKSSQAFYKASKRERMNNRHAKMIEKEVLKIRIDQPRIGGKKLYHLLKPFLIDNGIKQGRHKFLDTLRSRNLMIKKKKYKRKTTNSNHHYRKYPNKAKDIKVTKANQLWVSDITYIAFGRTFYYLHLVQDAYSRKIVGWHLSDNLKAEGTIAALKMAVATLPRITEVFYRDFTPYFVNLF